MQAGVDPTDPFSETDAGVALKGVLLRAEAAHNRCAAEFF